MPSSDWVTCMPKKSHETENGHLVLLHNGILELLSNFWICARVD